MNTAVWHMIRNFDESRAPLGHEQRLDALGLAGARTRQRAEDAFAVVAGPFFAKPPQAKEKTKGSHPHLE